MICICVGHQGDGPNLETEAGAVAGTMCGLTCNQIIGAQTRYKICAFLIKERPGGTGTRSNPLLLTINGLKQNPMSIAYSGRCYDLSEDSFYMIIRVDQAGTDSMGIIKVVLHSKSETVSGGYIPVNGTSAPQRLRGECHGFGLRDLQRPICEVCKHMIQVETGYIDKNTWLDWITYTASTNNMIECVACSTAHPTLFTVTAPLLFREDRPGFDCMLQLHMKEEVGHD